MRPFRGQADSFKPSDRMVYDGLMASADVVILDGLLDGLWLFLRYDGRGKDCGWCRAQQFLHVLSIDFEVEEVQILLHSFLMNSLRDDDYIALQQPT